MTEERKVFENARIKVFDENGAYLREDNIPVTYYNVDYYICDDRIIIPLTDEQQKAELRIVRNADEFGRIIIPFYLRKIYNLTTEAGIETKGNNIIISNNYERKVKINEIGMITIPGDILRLLKIKPLAELNIEASKNIILSMV